MSKEKFSHYYKKVPGEYIDVYRVLQLFEVSDPCIQHAVKKLLVAGKRGLKGLDKDVKEAIVSLERWQEMRNEEREYYSIPNEIRTNTIEDDEKEYRQCID